MKKTIFYLLLCITTLNVNAMSFTIQGNIEGLMPGDTLTFERFTIPGFHSELAFQVIVEKPNEFTYTGTHEHIGSYIMTYKPVSGTVARSDRTGLSILIEDGTTRLTGTTADIYRLSIQGGLYDSEALQEIRQLDNLLGKERMNLMRLVDEARAVGDSIKMREYGDRFNTFRSERQDDFQRLSQLQNAFYEAYPNSPHTIVSTLQMIMTAPFETTLSRFEKMNDEARNSYFGQILTREIGRMEALQPGNSAPDFHLITTEGREISLSDLAGSYVLIYHWGLCPGSLQVNNWVVDLHNQFSEHLVIIGVTDRIEVIRNLYDNTQPGSMFMNNLELKPILANMLAHPWLDAERIIGNNNQIATDFAFGGLPFFVFISPDGKIISRDFFSTFNIARNRMEEKFGARQE